MTKKPRLEKSRPPSQKKRPPKKPSEQQKENGWAIMPTSAEKMTSTTQTWDNIHDMIKGFQGHFKKQSTKAI